MKLDLETNVSNSVSVVENYSSDVSRETQPSGASAMLEAGITAAQHGNRAEAKILLLRATETEPGNEEAWMWLASVTDSPEEKSAYLQKVLSLDPKNENAIFLLFPLWH